MEEFSELQQRVLSELEEAWQLELDCMLNTIIEPVGDPRELHDYRRALIGLIQSDDVRMGLETSVLNKPGELSKSASLEMVRRLDEWLAFDAGINHWFADAGDRTKNPFPVVYLTEAGDAKAFRILDERGYQWWRE